MFETEKLLIKCKAGILLMFTAAASLYWIVCKHHTAIKHDISITCLWLLIQFNKKGEEFVHLLQSMILQWAHHCA